MAVWSPIVLLLVIILGLVSSFAWWCVACLASCREMLLKSKWIPRTELLMSCNSMDRCLQTLQKGSTLDSDKFKRHRLKTVSCLLNNIFHIVSR